MKVSMPKERLEFYFFFDKFYYRRLKKEFPNLPLLRYIWSLISFGSSYRRDPYAQGLDRHTPIQMDQTWGIIRNLIYD